MSNNLYLFSIHFPAFSIPLALRYLTMKGVDDNVMEILTGANTLCTAYATTKCRGPAPKLAAGDLFTDVRDVGDIRHDVKATESERPAKRPLDLS